MSVSTTRVQIFRTRILGPQVGLLVSQVLVFVLERVSDVLVVLTMV